MAAYISRCDGNQESRPLSGRARPLSLDPPRAAAAATARRCTAAPYGMHVRGFSVSILSPTQLQILLGKKKEKNSNNKTDKRQNHCLSIHTFVIHTHPNSVVHCSSSSSALSPQWYWVCYIEKSGWLRLSSYRCASGTLRALT